MNRLRLSLFAACTTVRISTSPSGARASGASRLSSVSPDASWVAFENTAANLVAGDTNGARDVFLHVPSSGATTRVSVAPDGSQANAA